MTVTHFREIESRYSNKTSTFVYVTSYNYVRGNVKVVRYIGYGAARGSLDEALIYFRSDIGFLSNPKIHRLDFTSYLLILIINLHQN